MKKAECIRRYGEGEYDRRLQQRRDWRALHHLRENAKSIEWYENNSEHVKAKKRERCHKGGKCYESIRKYNTAGIQGERNRIRSKHAGRYRPLKRIIALESVIHHEWIPSTADYRGVALVETGQHMHGYIDVIQILEGQITLFTEMREIRAAML